MISENKSSTYVYVFVIHSFLQLFFLSFLPSFIQPSIHSFTHSLTHSFIYSLFHSFILHNSYVTHTSFIHSSFMFCLSLYRIYSCFTAANLFHECDHVILLINLPNSFPLTLWGQHSTEGSDLQALLSYGDSVRYTVKRTRLILLAKVQISRGPELIFHGHFQQPHVAVKTSWCNIWLLKVGMPSRKSSGTRDICTFESMMWHCLF